MPAPIIMGGQWGDEGKGKLTDVLAGRADLVIRANGGSNAGHTVITEAGTFKLRLVPSGILNPDCVCIIGTGVVVETATLVKEIRDLRARGISFDNFVISERAHVVLPYHPVIDTLEELAREEQQIGTTRLGNGPAYADKAARRGVRIADLRDPETLQRVAGQAIDEHNDVITRFYGAPALDREQMLRELEEEAQVIRPFIRATENLVQDYMDEGKEAVIECAQAAMLDVDYGTYPYVTSSATTAAGACQGAGIAPTQVSRVIAVYKAYTTRVGGGPMPTELHGELAHTLRERAQEYGTGTGRARRIGWFDGVPARQAARLNGVTEINLYRLDILDELDEIQICVGYEKNGVISRAFPAVIDDLKDATPVYETYPGWQSDISEAGSIAELPENARRYIAAIERIVGAPVTTVGTGPMRHQLVGLSGQTPTPDLAGSRS
ncbi:adenylosuccinate synthase [soil metagenome]